ncbi:MAG: hypothetical protein ACPLX8_00580, partial [Nanopusillaceae archaeon]
LSSHNLIMIIPAVLPYIYMLIKDKDLFNKINNITLGRFIREQEISKRILLIILLSLLALPRFFNLFVENLLNNPFISERMGFTIAEYQATPASFYLGLMGSVGIIFTYLGLANIIFDKDKPKKILYIQYMFVLLISLAELIFSGSLIVLGILLLLYYILVMSISDKGEGKVLRKSMIELVILSLSLQFVLFSDIIIGNSFISIFISWIMLLFVVTGYIIISNRKLTDKELFILSLSIISLVVGKYVYRLVYYSGFVIPFLVAYGVESFNIFREDFDKLKKVVKIVPVILLLILAAISGYNAGNYLHSFYSYIGRGIAEMNVNAIIPIYIIIIIPFAFLLSYIFYELILGKETNRFNMIKYGIFLLVIYGVLLYPVKSSDLHQSYLLYNYISPIGVAGSGTPSYEINTFLWIRYNTPEDAIINSWWDYGYYIFTLGNRTAWVTGSNQYPYWNHLMGRYGLSSTNITETLQLFYVHANYNYQTFKTLELFNENSVFYDYIYDKLGFSKEEVNNIKNIKNRLGYNNWIKLLYQFNGSESSIYQFNLSKEELYLLNKLYNMSYLRPAYFYIDPTDIGKSTAFQFLGSNSSYDKESWISVLQSFVDTNPGMNFPSVYYNGYYVLATNNSLFYVGQIPLDQDLYIDGNLIQRCLYKEPIGIINKNSCGVIFQVQLLFNQSIVIQSGIYQTLDLAKINPNNLVGANIYVYNPVTGKYHVLSLKYVYFAGELIEFKNATYGGMLYISPSYSMLASGNLLGLFGYAHFITEKAFNYNWIQLYFLNNDYNGTFNLVYYSNQEYGLSPLIYIDIPPAKVWKVNFPSNFTVPDHLYCLYLATNLNEINECAKIYNLKPFKTHYDV